MSHKITLSQNLKVNITKNIDETHFLERKLEDYFLGTKKKDSKDQLFDRYSMLLRRKFKVKH